MLNSKARTNSIPKNSIEEYDSIVRDLALQTGFPVVFPEYTLAPKVQFPVQHNQCYESLKWLTENGETLGLQGTNFTLVGDSAGGKFIWSTRAGSKCWARSAC